MKLALITGGSKGLGKSLVDKYLGNGFKVLEFSRSGKSENNVKCDFSDLQGFPALFNSILSGFENYDISEMVLINNAGNIDPIGPISKYQIQDWINHVNINFTASIIVTGLFIKQFQSNECRKSIAFISSGAAIRSKYGWSLYCASKAGLEQFYKTVSTEQELEDSPIKFVIIDPDIIDTEMQTKIRETESSLFPESQRFISFKSDGLLRSPESVADKIYTVISDPLTETGRRYTVSEN